MNSKWLNGKGRCAGLGGDDSDDNGRGGGDFDDDDDKRAMDMYIHRNLHGQCSPIQNRADELQVAQW